MISFSKMLFFKLSQIRISGIDCNYSNLSKIIDVFDMEHIIITIDSVTEESMLLKYVREQPFEYYLNKTSNGYMEVSIVTSKAIFNTVLEISLNEDPENVFLSNLIDHDNHKYQFRYPQEEIVSKGITDMTISISLDENEILIYLNKELLHPKTIYKKLKALSFE